MACCQCLGVGEDTGRFVLLALVILLYLLGGAGVFSALEAPTELQVQERWASRLRSFSRSFNISQQDLSSFLRSYEEAKLAGVRVDSSRACWDFTGAFYFVGTVVSTIGFGMTTPATTAGKIFLIFYGLIGCAATILFFNLFLERVITVIAIMLKFCHEHRQQRKVALPENSHVQHVSVGHGARQRDSLSGWKPSVYCLMTILGAAAVLVSCCASVMYSAVEGWDYLDSLYFCFVAFSTIGFGDMVSSQRENYEGQVVYRLANFLFILTGVCCIYSLFNIISITIKQVLNWLLKWLEALCLCPGQGNRRNVIVPGDLRDRRDASNETNAGNESEGAERRMSGEIMSMKDFLAANKVNLAIMQKQLSEMPNGHHHPWQATSSSHYNGFSAGIGALGIMNNRLAETSEER